MKGILKERSRREWAAPESRATGLSWRTLRKGRRERETGAWSGGETVGRRAIATGERRGAGETGGAAEPGRAGIAVAVDLPESGESGVGAVASGREGRFDDDGPLVAGVGLPARVGAPEPGGGVASSTTVVIP